MLKTTKYSRKENYIFQFPFWISEALIEIADSIRCLLEYGNHILVMCLFADLTKAFDTVGHGILLYKLSHYGIRGHVNNFFLIIPYKQITIHCYYLCRVLDQSCIMWSSPRAQSLDLTCFLFIYIYIYDLYR